jgi:aspartate/methionine/tyrosine aminotransferase
VCNVAQAAALAAVGGPLDCVVEMRAAFERRAATAHRLLNGMAGTSCFEPQGAFYAFPNLSALLNRPVAGRTATTTAELAEIFLDEAKVALVPGEAFGAPGYARVSCALSDADLEEGLDRLAALVSP